MTHKFVILDEIMNQLEAAQSGVVPGSITQAVVSGVQNVPANITQSRIGGNSSTSYTTLPLSPIVKNCCLDKTYINMEFDCNFGIKILFFRSNFLIVFNFNIENGKIISNSVGNNSISSRQTFFVRNCQCLFFC